MKNKVYIIYKDFNFPHTSFAILDVRNVRLD